MGDSLNDYTEDLTLIENYSHKLSPQGLYIAGLAKAKSNEPLKNILKILAFIQSKYDSNKLNDTNKAIIEFNIYQGKIEKATEQLKKLQKATVEDEGPKPVQTMRHQPIQNPGDGSYIRPAPPSEANKNGQSLSLGQVAEIEQKLLDVIQILKLEEQEDLLRRRKQQEQKRLEAEREAKEAKQRELNELEEKKKKEETMKCGLCKDLIPEDELRPLDACGHLHHKDCINNELDTAIYTQKFPLICPSPNCKVEMTHIDIKERLTKDQYKAYEDQSFKFYLSQNAQDLCSCPTAHCRNMFELDTDAGYYKCPMCIKEYCLHCRTDYHNGFSCDQMNRNRHGMETEFYPGLKMKACQNCRMWVEKGADSVMRCRCGWVFCFDCGIDTRNCKCKR